MSGLIFQRAILCVPILSTAIRCLSGREMMKRRAREAVEFFGFLREHRRAS